MTPEQLASFDRCHAAHQAFLASYQTSERCAAIVESAAAEQAFMAAMPGATVWVKADYVPAGVMQGLVSEAYAGGDIRCQHGVITWGNFCPASYSVDLAHLFFAEAQAALDDACSRP